MAKEKVPKREKKEKKEKRSETDGVKKLKKEKKEKKERKISDATADKIIEEAEKSKQIITNGNHASPEPGKQQVVEKDEKKSKKEKKEKKSKKGEDAEEEAMVIIPDEDGADLLGAQVPFANPLADAKTEKKILEIVAKAAKYKTLRRGVKEVVKSLRKSPTNLPSSSDLDSPLGVVILAGNISPMDVISHIPILCEDHNIPYIFVPHRGRLGAAGATKRPTSVVKVMKDRPKKKAGEESDSKEGKYQAVYTELVSIIRKASQSVKK